ncbi:hypothetical protein [Candidatus Nitronereus thalassa]|uniref:Uncharacterized protein n=1 Tax=Candidatus Nitronereus thalassa TaxID=3020898 RepID=A0ABU3K4I5_9BACT|nr:hypothetical protein [Candidatus Nitronereus thalassa]MDT7041286.1 hypothetical protein [Candidatus Nitronereus thalassa]
MSGFLPFRISKNFDSVFFFGMGAGGLVNTLDIQDFNEFGSLPVGIIQ